MAYNLGEVGYCTRGGVDAEDMPHWGAQRSEIKAYHYPFCCSGAVLAGLGGSSRAFGRRATISLGQVKEQLLAWIVAFTSGGLRGEGKQFISVCTTHEQKTANKALKELGFKKSSPINNTKYDGKLYTWMLELHPKEKK